MSYKPRKSYGLAVGNESGEEGQDNGGYESDSDETSFGQLNTDRLQKLDGVGQRGRTSMERKPPRPALPQNSKPNHHPRVGTPQPVEEEATNSVGDNSEDEDNLKYEWDIFKESDKEPPNYGSSHVWNTIRKLVRVLTAVFSFLILTTTLIVSKLSIFVATTAVGVLVKEISPPHSDENGSSTTPAPNATAAPPAPLSTGASVFAQMEVPSECSVRLLVLWTWALLGIVCIPQLLTLFKCLWKVIGVELPSLKGYRFLLVALAVEFFHCLGVSMLLLEVLPNLSVVHAMGVLMGAAIIPGLVRALSGLIDENKCAPIQKILDWAAFVVLLSSAFGDIIINSVSGAGIEGAFQFHFALILVSVRWWANYFTDQSFLCQPLVSQVVRPISSKFISYKSVMKSTNHLEMSIVSIWKTIVYLFAFMSFFVHASGGVDVKEFFNPSAPDNGTCWPVTLGWSAPFLLMTVQLTMGLLAFYTATHACKVLIQRIGFSLPLFVATPATVGVAYLMDGYAAPYLFHQMYLPTPDGWVPDGNEMVATVVPLCLLAAWWLAQVWVTRSVWFPTALKIASQERLFLLPMFDSEALEQSLLLNRRDDAEYYEEEHPRPTFTMTPDQPPPPDIETGPILIVDPKSKETRVKRNPLQAFVYMCATMWHETEDEMKQILKSVFKVDKFHHKRKLAKQFFDAHDPDYFDFEAHIFMDDAFTAHLEDEDDYQLGKYAKQLLQVVNVAANMVHGDDYFSHPERTVTPYGGRFTWTMPGGNKLIAHLKDKAKIRNKKRWSQVMYMYYFLGHQLITNPLFSEKEKANASVNTYLLALDGDVGFEPEALILLIDLMKTNKKVGAACGRIHPLGSGPIVWYQKFEYAVSHWLQKATEHVLGCVLCSPGCFSLFRAQALMDENVMKRYSTISSEASNYLQYDQGEDRWLCTLLLQQGWRVEYNAASDAYTFAPEAFGEFFNQRRRWGPSTMANILDLILDFSNVIKKNPYMSTLYMIYQMVIFGSSILGPGTIFLMVTGAISLIFQGDIISSFLLMAVPVSLYIVVSFLTKKDTQLKLAMFLSTIYAIIMCIVLVSIVLEISESACSPTAIFFYSVSGVFIICAIMHPQEFWCLPSGLVYYLLIPCMYMLQIIFSFVNLNDVSWGTREVKTDQTHADLVKQRQETQRKAQKVTISGLINNFLRKEEEGGEEGTTFSCGGACKVVCCPRPTKPIQDTLYLSLIDKSDTVIKMLKEEVIPKPRTPRSRQRPDSSDYSSDGNPNDSTSEDDDPEEMRGSAREKPAPEPPKKQKTVTFGQERRPYDKPMWLEDDESSSWAVTRLDAEEVDFWNNFITTYLKPLNHDAKKQDEVKKQLLDLRNMVTFGFFLINAIFITVMFLLQLKKSEYEQLTFRWPLNGDCTLVKDNATIVTIRNATHTITGLYGEISYKRPDEIEPISFVFLVFFLLVIALQFVGMLVHRLGTFWHIIATTIIQLVAGKDVPGKPSTDLNKVKDIIDIVYETERKDSEESDISNNVMRTINEARRSTVRVNKNQQIAEQLEKLALDNDEEAIHNPLLRTMSMTKRRDTINWLKKNKRLTTGGGTGNTPQINHQSIRMRPSGKVPRHSLFRYDENAEKRRAHGMSQRSRSEDHRGGENHRGGAEWRAQMDEVRNRGRGSRDIEGLPPTTGEQLNKLSEASNHTLRVTTENEGRPRAPSPEESSEEEPTIQPTPNGVGMHLSRNGSADL